MSYLEELDLDEEGLTEEEIKKRKTKIFVGGLKYSSKDDVLKEYFSQFGEIEEAVVIYDRESGLSKGYGFVSTIHQIHSSLSFTCLLNVIPFPSLLSFCKPVTDGCINLAISQYFHCYKPHPSATKFLLIIISSSA